MKQYWTWLVCAAVVYALPFVASETAWYTVFIFPFLLFAALITQRCSFWQGFVFGAIGIGLHLSGVFYSIMYLADGALIHKMIPWIGGTLYFALYVGLWFFITARIQDYIRIAFWRDAITFISVWLLFVSFDYVCLTVFNTMEGLFLLNPLLPLAECPGLLRPLVYIGKQGLLFVFFAIPFLNVVSFVRRSVLPLCLSVFCVFVWAAIALMPPKCTQAPAWLADIAFLKTSFYEVSNNQLQNAELLGVAVKDHLAAVAKQLPRTRLFILPESSLVECPLPQCSAALKYWTHEKINSRAAMLIGAFNRDERGLHNAVYHIRDGVIHDTFEKRHAMLLTENIAPWWDFGVLHDLYFKGWSVLAVSANERKPLQLLDEQAFVPYICSELFFRQHPDDAYPELPILVVCNDTWVKTPYIRRLMLLEARIKAIQWHRCIVYASFFNAAYIMPE